IRRVAKDMGLVGEEMDAATEKLLEELFAISFEPLTHQGPYDYGTSDMSLRLRDKGVTLRTGGFVHTPPPVSVFFHRKFGGIHLLATKLKAQVDWQPIMTPYLEN
ncbi:MAG: AarF/ABC1/UbiB kinase family protein, partial [Pseudomonadota bacterium]